MKKVTFILLAIPFVILSSCSKSTTPHSSQSIDTTSTISLTPDDDIKDPEDVEMSRNDRLYSEMWRPQFHYSDPNSWLNDPNGLVYADGIWHMYYQATPHVPASGAKYWGHAVSEDLVHWEFIDYPLSPDATGHMWSGTAVSDPTNLSGLFDENASDTGIIAAYSTDRQTVGLAYSKDGGYSFTKFSNSVPVIPNPGTPDFRDPCLFYYPEDEMWKIAIAGGQFKIYESSDLRSWRLCSSNNIYTECPCFFKIRTVDTDEEKWVLTCSSRGYYVGSFDGKKFTPETPYINMNSDLDSYAGIIFNDAPNNRVIMLNWMQNISGGYMMSEGIWSQQMTLPLELNLYSDSQFGYRLKQNPVSELNVLRREVLLNVENINTNGENILKDIRSNTFEMDLEIDLEESTDFSLILASDGKGSDEVKISYDIANSKLTLDRSKNKYGFDNMTTTNGRYTIKVNENAIENGILKLHIYFDVSCMEVFVNDGYQYIPMKCNPFTSSKEMNIVGDVQIIKMLVFDMRSSWFHHKEDINGVHLADNTTLYVEKGSTNTREAASFNGKELSFESSNESLFTAKMTNNLIEVTGHEVGEGSLKIICGLRFKEIKVVVYDSESATYKNMLGELETSNATLSESPFGLTLKAGSGDGFAFSRVLASDFTYESDITLSKGGAASLLFRANGTTNFYCFNIDYGGGYFKLWKRVNNNFTDLSIHRSSVRLGTTYHLEVVCQGNNIKCYVDDTLVIDVNDTSHNSGYLGLNVYNATALYNNIVYEGGTMKTGVKNEITGLGEMTSSSCYTEQYDDGSFAIINTGGGDCFSLSNVTKKDFTISSNIRLAGIGAASFLLRAQDINNFYCINIDSSAKCVKFWKRVNGQAIVVFTYPTTINSNIDYLLKVELSGSVIKTYFQGSLINESNDTSFSEGLIGFNAWQTNGEFRNFELSD